MRACRSLCGFFFPRTFAGSARAASGHIADAMPRPQMLPVGKSGPGRSPSNPRSSFWPVDQGDRRVDHLAEIMRRDIGPPCRRDAAGAIDEEIGVFRRKHGWLPLASVVIPLKSTVACRGRRGAGDMAAARDALRYSVAAADRRRRAEMPTGRRSTANASRRAIASRTSAS